MRLFAALALPWSVREQLAALSGSGVPGARWVPPENYHLTLRFIGDIPTHVARDVDEALLGLRARGFALTLSGMGTFAKSGVSSALWVGIERNLALDHLRAKIETALQRTGLEPERRPGDSPTARPKELRAKARERISRCGEYSCVLNRQRLKPGFRED